MAARKATAKQNPGRPGWLVEFRHPLRIDKNEKAGKKIRKGLGTTVQSEAEELVAQLNELLANEALWSLGAKEEAARLYKPEIIEIFYGEVEPRTFDSRGQRQRVLPMPKDEEGYSKIVLVGVPGAGKTTLVRQLIGTDPKGERFPSTSVNRTTTFPTEIICRPGEFEAVATFISEQEARFGVEESITAAVIEAAQGDFDDVARVFLEKSDMRFRLKYLLGDFETGPEEQDPYEEPSEEEGDTQLDQTDSTITSDSEQEAFAAIVRGFVERICVMAQAAKARVESGHGPLADMQAEDQSAALDLIEEDAAASDKYVDLVSDVLDEIRSRVSAVGAGELEKTTTGWPRLWHLKSHSSERQAFFSSTRRLTGIGYRSWGKLLTPLVNGIRVQGPFMPSWSQAAFPLVLLDTEGLGHKAAPNADLDETVISLLHEADAIVLVDNAKNGMTNFAAGKALETIVNIGHARKLSVVFTHMDSVHGENLKGQAKLDYVFLGLRNVAENQVAKNISVTAARSLLSRLEKNTYYVGRINNAEPRGAVPELQKLVAHLTAARPPVVQPAVFPEYSPAHLILVIQSAARDFRGQWQAFLGFSTHPDHKAKPWQSIKAVSRRYAEGWDDNYPLRPTSNLYAALVSAASRFLENPIGWSGRPSPDEQRDAIDQLKVMVAKELPAVARRRLRELPQHAWHDAWALRNEGSTRQRRIQVEGIFERWVPIPDERGDQSVLDFMKEVEAVVLGAIETFKQKVESARGDGQERAA